MLVLGAKHSNLTLQVPKANMLLSRRFSRTRDGVQPPCFGRAPSRLGLVAIVDPQFQPCCFEHASNPVQPVLLVNPRPRRLNICNVSRVNFCVSKMVSNSQANGHVADAHGSAQTNGSVHTGGDQYSPRSILITGGAGFIASHVVTQLLDSHPEYKVRRVPY